MGRNRAMIRRRRARRMEPARVRKMLLEHHLSTAKLVLEEDRVGEVGKYALIDGVLGFCGRQRDGGDLRLNSGDDSAWQRLGVSREMRKDPMNTQERGIEPGLT